MALSAEAIALDIPSQVVKSAHDSSQLVGKQEVINKGVSRPVGKYWPSTVAVSGVSFASQHGEG